ncbi:MAG TPA: outer membrane protein assembly factor BamD [Candidatus Marinimicrobia bacterium]|nr:outer membrane protein assembly factor BamD [Candidatus Neomarinimicrobiota bacterium]
MVSFKSLLKSTAILFLVLTLASCSGKKEILSDSLQERFEQGLAEYEKEKYYKAIDHFTFVVFNSPGSEIADDAQLYLADCHFNLKEYLVAIDEYQRLIRRWPASPLVESARYKIAASYNELSPTYQRDQTYTHQAIQSYQRFLEDYPYSNNSDVAMGKIKELRSKLAKKAYDSGKLYMVLHEWKAAVISFEELVDSYWDTEWIDPGYLAIAQCYAKMEDTENSARFLSQVNPKKLSNPQDILLYRNLSGDQ